MGKPKVVRVGLVQMHCQADMATNLQQAIDGVRQAAAQGAKLICLPELFRSLYFCQTQDASHFDLAESIPGPSTTVLGALAEELGVVVVASLFERRAAGVYHNTTVVLERDGTLCGKYRKMHIPDDPLFYEKYYFTPGDLGFNAFPTSSGQVGTLICWDQWFPEAARLTALRGAEILLYPTAIGWHQHEKEEYGPEQHDAWETVQRGHAISNGVFVAAVNRVGHEGTLEFWGQSFVADPMGKILARAGLGDEVLVVDCDLSRIEYVRRHWPFWRDRRIDAFAGLERRVLD